MGKNSEEYDIEVRAFEVAKQLAESMEEQELEQAFFAPIRDGMLEAFNAGYAARSLPNRVRHALMKWSEYRGSLKQRRELQRRFNHSPTGGSRR
jgi:hypothetical protein